MPQICFSFIASTFKLARYRSFKPARFPPKPTQKVIDWAMSYFAMLSPAQFKPALLSPAPSFAPLSQPESCRRG